MSAKVFSLRVVSPVETVFEGEVTSVIVPTWDGKVGILAGHAPFMSLLGGGMLEAELPGGGTTSYFLHRGVVKVEDDRVTVLSEYAGSGPPEGYESGDGWLDPEQFEGEASA
jgi:F-type H+-transporting ATPase subunit epsilon